MARSQTIYEIDPLPYWARYAVVICHSHTRTERPLHDVVQVFASKSACERWAREVSRYFPAREGDDLTLWALVYALDGVERYGRTFTGLHYCYLSYDPGGVELKRHAIQPGYGLPRPKPREAQRCVCCGTL